MPSYTTSLRLIQPATGEYSGSWGTQVNNGITALVDTSVAGTASITMTTADYTLSTANGATDEARAMFLVLGGTPGAARNVICPAVSKLYYVTNNTTGGFAQTVKTASGSGISVPNGASMVLRCDGTNVVEAQNALGSIVLNGGTANGVAYLNASKALTTGSALVFDGTNLGVGTNVLGGAKVVIEGTSAAPGVFNALMLRNASDGGAALIFDNSVSAPLASIEALVTSTGTGTDDAILAFGTATNGSNTEKMRLDSSGNLGVGTSSPASRLDVTGAFGTSTTALTIYNNTASSASNIARIDFRVNNTFGGNERAAAIWGINPNAAGNNGGALVFGTSSDGTATTPTERARITSDGKLALGWPEARADLDVGTNTATAITKSIHLGFSDDDYYGFRIANTNTASVTYAGTLAFQRGNGSAWVDVAIITDGGEFLVGASTINGVGTTLLSSTPSRITQNNNGASSGFVFTSYQRSSTEIGSITQDGTTAVLYNTTSDRRLKDNIVPAPSASAVIDAIEIVSHDWKAAPDEHVTYGVIAQDLALVAPQAVLQGDESDEIEKTWGVDYSKLVPMLIKEIQSLRARVAALEAA